LRQLRGYGSPVEKSDPGLTILLRTFAAHLGSVYSDVEGIRLGLLDELIAVLGIPHRMARPAQTVASFRWAGMPEQVGAGTDLIGETDSGAKLVFRTDAAILVSNAVLSFAAAYEEGALRLINAAEMPKEMQDSPPSLGPVPGTFVQNTAL